MAFPDKQMAPKPPAGMQDAPKMPGMDDQAEEKGEPGLAEINAKLDKIISALGLDEADQQEPDQPEMPMNSGGPDQQQQ